MIPRYSNPEMARIWSEEHKLELWLRVEIAVCEGWTRRGAIPPEAMEQIRAASLDVERFRALMEETHHDVISFIRAVAERLGEAGRFVHLGLTSSDVLDTAGAIQAVEALDLLATDLVMLEEVLTRRALRHRRTLMVGRTHGVYAEPTTFGFKLAGWVAETRRNRDRLARAREVMAVGKIAGAVGTHAHVPPDLEEEVLADLGLRPEPVATQVVQRDRHAEFLALLAVVAASLEKFALEIRHLQRTEVGEAFEPFSAGQQGSSAMPHKRNPELCERICGLARLIRGYALPALENVALWHERDISHSSVERVILPDACLALDYILRLFTRVMDGLEVDEERMRANLEAGRGMIFSGRLLLALVERGMGRNDAYELVQRHAKQVWRGVGDLRTLVGADSAVRERLSERELDEIFDPAFHLRHIDVAFQRLGLLQGQ